MGQGLSCGLGRADNFFFATVQGGDLQTFLGMVEKHPELLNRVTVYERLYPLHVAAANGRVEVGFFSYSTISSYSCFLGRLLISSSTCGVH